MFIRRAPKISGENAVFELKEIRVGHDKQWIYIRGENKRHPILLMLHGGPGTGHIGFYRKFQTELEKHFVVVQWDQRGAGLSYSKKIPSESMNIDQFVNDTVEVTNYLLEYLTRQQLYLVGHSWGTILGMLTIKRAPQLYKRYFGVAQVTDVAASERLSYTKLLEKAKMENYHKAYEKLLHIGSPPWDNLKSDRIHQNYVEALGGGITRDGKLVRKILINLLTSKEYTIFDSIRFLQGQFFSMNHLQEEMRRVNLIETVDEVEIPINFLMGRHDLITPFEPTEDFYHKLKAPEKKWVMFEESAHTPNIEEPKKSMDTILSEVRKFNQ